MKDDLETLEFEKVLKELSSYAKTFDAKRKIGQLVPAVSYEQACLLQAQTEEALECLLRYEALSFSQLQDVRNILLKAGIGSVLAIDELLDVVGLISCSASAIEYFKRISELKISTAKLSAFFEKIASFPMLKENILLCVKEDKTISDTASRELFAIRKNLRLSENRLRSKLNELLISKSSMLTEPLIVLRDNRMCLPVKMEYKNSFKGMIHDISSSQSTCYIEPESTLEMANQMENERQEEEAEIRKILKNLSLMVESEADGLLQNLEMLSDLDVIFAKAQMGKERNYTFPKISQDHTFVLKRARHPLIDSKIVVPIDVSLSEHTTMIITGPNTGGKTVVLKTIGLLHLMGLSGMMIPVRESSKISYFRHILSDIDDEQSIEQSLSTFSAHLTKMKHILETADEESLVLLDELGSGTDPKEGSSLAIAMIGYLKNHGAKTIVTTHYSELKTYAYREADIQNASVEFDSNTLQPTYRLLMGIPGKSNALEIALRLGIPDEIIEESRKYLEDQKNDSGKLLGNLEEEMNKIHEKEEDLTHKITMYEELLQDVRLQKNQLAKQANQMMEKARFEAKALIDEKKKEAEELLNRVISFANQDYKEHEIAQVKHDIRSLNVEEQKSLFAEDFKVGDYVYIKNFEQYGTILKIKKNLFEVQMGQYTMSFPIENLEKAVRPKEVPEKKLRMSGYLQTSHVSASLDLRGKRAEEVKDLLDQYLDRAVLGNLGQVTIIHGFGTGAVRKAVWTYLKDCPYAKEYRYGQEGEGLNGVTVVTLK